MSSRSLAKVTVVDSPLIRDAIVFAKNNSSTMTYNHVMRSWLYGALLLSKDNTLQNNVDLEVHAVATVLHDLGWDQTPDSSLVSTDKRFEVDGAIGAREFIRSHDDGKRWEERRVQLVWDAIALHTQPPIALFKEPEVQLTSKGIFQDFAGPGNGLDAAEYQAVVEEFPNDGFKEGVSQTMVWLCNTKPSTTWDTFQQPWGDRLVPGYAESKVLAMDVLMGTVGQ